MDPFITSFFQGSVGKNTDASRAKPRADAVDSTHKTYRQAM
jgi:hypothetical protein